MLRSGPMKKRPYSHLKDDVLLAETFDASVREKAATMGLLEYLLEVDRRRAFAVDAYSTLFDYVVRGLGYSEAQATERVNSVRLMRTLEGVREHLKSGKLSMSSAAKIQRHFKAEKRLATDLSTEEKIEIVNRCLEQPKREVDRILLSEASEPVVRLMSERVTVVSRDRTELKFCIADGTRRKLDRVRELVGGRPLEALFDAALDALLDQEEKKRRIRSRKGGSGAAVPPSAAGTAARKPRSGAKGAAATASVIIVPPAPAEPVAGSPTDPVGRTLPATQPSRSTLQSRYIPVEIRRIVHLRALGQCEYVSERNGERCPSRYRLQFDHRIPLALGGLTEWTNVRLLCENHNQRAAQEAGLSRPAS